MNIRKPSTLGLTLLAIIAMLTWGLSWSNGHILAGSDISVAHLIFWRFFLASAFFTPVVFLSQQWKINDTRGVWGAILGGILIASYNLFFFLGSHLGLAGTGGVLVTTLNPILTTFLASFWFHRSLKRKDYFGLVLGILGGLLIIRIWHTSWSELFQSGNGFFLLCAVSWAFLTVVTEQVRDSISVMTFSLITYWVAGALALPFSLAHGIGSVFALDWIFWLNLFAVSIGAMAFGTTVYFFATKALGSEKSSAFIFVVPVSAMFFAWWILSEPFTLTTISGGFLAIMAVYLINKK